MSYKRKSPIPIVEGGTGDTSIAQYNVVIGNGTSGLAVAAPSATIGVPLISQGAAANPAFGTSVVAGGGSGATSFVAYTPICGGTTTTGALQSVAALGSSGDVLTSNGAGMLPTFQTPAGGGVTSITGTANQITASAATGAVTLSTPSTFIAPGSIAATTTVTATLGNVTITSGNLAITAATTSSVGQITQASNRIVHTYGGDGAGDDTDSNLFVGKLAGNFTLNTAVNFGGNVGIGYNSLLSIDGATENVGVGNRTLKALVGAHNGSTGYRNVALGTGSMALMASGTYNIGIGYHAGAIYTTTESSNINLNHPGVLGESHVLHIGAATGTGDGGLNKAFICGLYNTAVGATSNILLVDSTNQVGGLAGSANTVLMGGAAPSFTGSPSFSGTVTSATGLTNTTGTITLSSGSSAINIGTDAVAKTVTIGNTTGATTLAINTGTGDITMASATGNLIKANDTGEIQFPLTPAFNYYLASSDNSVTGNGATYTFGTTGNALTKVFDQGTNATTAGVFTAPITGKYELGVFLRINGLTAAMTAGVLTIVTTGVSYAFSTNSGGIRTGGNIESQAFSSIVPMTAADTCTITLVISNGAGNAAGVSGGQGLSYFYGTLVC